MSEPARPSSIGKGLLGLHTILIYFFLYAPIVMLVVFSFNSSRQVAGWEGFTLDWYRKLWNLGPHVQPLWRQRMLDSVLNSLHIAGLTTTLAVLIGTPAGIALARARFPGRIPTIILLYLPLIIPEVLMGVALLAFYSQWEIQLSFWTIVASHVVFCASYVAIIVQARMAGMDRTLLEAAADLGASPLATFFRVTLPLITPGILAGALLSFTLSLDDYVITSLVKGPATLPVMIYDSVRTGVKPEMNAVCAVLLVFTVILIVLAQFLLREPRKGRES